MLKRISRCLATLILVPSLLLGRVAYADGNDTFAEELYQSGRLVVAVYRDFPPYSYDGKGIDVELARALAKKLGLDVEIMSVSARDDMQDDLKFYVWKGHYLNSRTADVMMHVPVDPVFIADNPQVQIFGSYQAEKLAIARNANRVAQMSGPAGLVAFTQEKIGVESDTLADVYLMSTLGGRLRSNVVHYRTVKEAAQGLAQGEVAAIMAPRTELEASLGEAKENYALSVFNDPSMPRSGWHSGLAIKDGRPHLQAALNKAMTELQSEGAVAGIYAKYGVAYLKPSEAQ